MKSTNAGKECSSYKDCPTSITGVYANCGCTYSSFSKRCDILYSNYEYQQFIDAVRHLIFYIYRPRNFNQLLLTAIMQEILKVVPVIS